MEWKVLTMMSMALMLTMGAVFAIGDDANTSVTLDVGNSAPVINTVSDVGALNPTSCAVTAVPIITLNISDNDGYGDIAPLSTYVEYTNGAVTHNATSCSVVENGTEWALFNCTGAEMNFYDVSGTWTVTAYTGDGDATDDMAGTSFTYNAAYHLEVVNNPITFGSVYAGTNGNANTNDPAFAAKNCGNTQFTSVKITGADITDGGSNTIGVGQFVANGGTNVTLTTGAQEVTSTLAVGADSKNTIGFFVNLPIGQAVATYNTGSWKIDGVA